MKIKSGDYEKLYKTLNSPVVKGTDCGKKCVSTGEKPLCCDSRKLLVNMRAEEFEHLKLAKGKDGKKQWYQPKLTKEEEKNLLPLANTEIPTSCSGPENCARRTRSIVCRSYPFQPFVTEAGDFVGIVLGDPSSVEGCWVADNLECVNPKFVAEMEAAWLQIFERDPTELFVHVLASKCYTAVSKKKKKFTTRLPIVMFDANASTPKGLRAVNLSERLDAKEEKPVSKKKATAKAKATKRSDKKTPSGTEESSSTVVEPITVNVGVEEQAREAQEDENAKIVLPDLNPVSPVAPHCQN